MRSSWPSHTIAHSASISPAFRFVQTEHRMLPLAKKRRLRRVQIFSGFCVARQIAPAESDYLADIVANREHEPPAKAVVNVTLRPLFIAQLDEAALQNRPALIALVERPFQAGVPAVRAKPSCHDFTTALVEAALSSGNLDAGSPSSRLSRFS